MQLESETLANGITQIKLTGRLDIAGSREIEMKFTALTATKKAAVVVNLSGVDFIASIGIRTLLSGARGQAGRGGKMVLLKPQPAVRGVLETAGIHSLIPTFDDDAAAEEAVKDVL
jgi:anti-anti-sigma factor